MYRKHKELKKFPLKELLTSEIFWERRLMIFSCVYSGGFTKLQCFVPNPELHRQPLTFEKTQWSINNQDVEEKEEENGKEEEEDRQT